MKRTLRFVVLLGLFIHHLIAWVNLAGLEKVKVNESVENKLRMFKDLGWRFLTNWNFFNQSVYIFLALLLYILPSFFNPKTIQKIRKFNWFNFWAIVVPWSIYIPILFWSVYNYDRELIFPTIIDHIFPLWLNHVVHTNIIFLILLEPVLNDERPPRIIPALRAITIHAIVYTALLLFTHFHNGVWLYAFLNILTWPQKAIYFAITYTALLVLVAVPLKLQNYIYDSSNKITEKCT